MILLRLEIKAYACASHQLSCFCEWLHSLLGRADFDLSFVFRTQRAVQMLGMLVLANSVCLLALSRSDRHVMALLLCAGLIAPCCAVFGVDARLDNILVYIYSCI